MSCLASSHTVGSYPSFFNFGSCLTRFQATPFGVVSRNFKLPRNTSGLRYHSTKFRLEGNHKFVCRATESQPEPDDKNDQETAETEETTSDTQVPESLNPLIIDASANDSEQQNIEEMKIPKETIDILKDQVFGFDTFFVTNQEPYEGGVLFKGNLRGKPSTSYDKISNRLQNQFGDQYKLFLLINPEDEKPVAVIIPRKTLQPETTPVPEWLAAASFGVVTAFTLLLHNVPALQSSLLSTIDQPELLGDGLVGALVTAAILGVHEFAHISTAKSRGIKLAVPFFVPSWQIGCFGGITRIVNIVQRREDLLAVATAGPLAGIILSFVLFIIGVILPPADGIGVVVDASAFHESLLVGGIAKIVLGDALKEGAKLSINPLVIWAWTGLLINAINAIPAGELDGGRISLALWGRKASSRLTALSLGLLGLSSLFNDVAFYWVILVAFLQRGPIAPLSDEVSDPPQNSIYLGVLVLLLGLLVCLPYPFPFSQDVLTNF